MVGLMFKAAVVARGTKSKIHRKMKRGNYILFMIKPMFTAPLMPRGNQVKATKKGDQG